MACTNHPELIEAASCAQCGKPFCKDCVVTLEGRLLCGPCKAEAVRRVERGETVDASGRVPSPWESRKSAGTLLQTVKLALLSPKAFFSTLQHEGKGVWSYLAVLAWPSALLGAAATTLTGFGLPEAADGSAPPRALMGGILFGAVLVAPLSAMIGAALYGAVAHLLLRIVGGATGKLEASVRTYAYANSVLVFSWVPVVGGVVGMVWMLIVAVIGLKEMHRTTYAKVILALVVPFGILMLIGIAAGIAVPLLRRG